jgi:tryptophanyl-tRNA synthetase
MLKRMNALLADIHIRREELKNKPDYVRRILEYGAREQEK